MVIFNVTKTLTVGATVQGGRVRVNSKKHVFLDYSRGSHQQRRLRRSIKRGRRQPRGKMVTEAKDLEDQEAKAKNGY